MAITFLLFIPLGCRKGMYDQPKYKPLAPSSLFPDGQSARPLVPGTLDQGALEQSEPFRTGMQNGFYVVNMPVKVTRELLERGQQRFNIYCSPCHDRLGNGTGMVVRRGFRPPPSYHIPRLVNAPDGYFFDVMTNGYGTMYSYSSRVGPADRWAIIAYIRALQFSQHATLTDVPPRERHELEGGKP